MVGEVMDPRIQLTTVMFLISVVSNYILIPISHLSLKKRLFFFFNFCFAVDRDDYKKNPTMGTNAENK